MNALRSLATSLSVLSALLLVGCGKDAPTPTAGGGGAEHGHEHGDAGPHGGEIQELGDAHEAHLELMHDHDGGTIAAYAYGKSFEEPVAIPKPTITVQLKEGGTAEVQLTAVEPKADGTAMGWKGQHPALIADPWLGRIDLVIGGKSYRAPLEGPAHAHK